MSEPDHKRRAVERDQLHARIAALEAQLSEARANHVESIGIVLSQKDALEKRCSQLEANVGMLRHACNHFVPLASLLKPTCELLDRLDGILSDIAAFGNCDCDIEKGKTCLVCEVSIAIKSLTQERQRLEGICNVEPQ